MVSLFVIAHSVFCQARRAVALPKVAALHRHAIEEVRQPRELPALHLHHRQQLNAGRLQARRVVTKAGAALDRAIAQLLQLLACRRLAGAQAMFEFALGHGAPFRFAGGPHRLQAEVTLDLPHQDFLAPIVVAVARDGAIKSYAARQQVNVFVLGVVVARDHVLVVAQAHPLQIALADLVPLFVVEMLARSGRQRHVQNGFA
jgi:hypothetical protein